MSFNIQTRLESTKAWLHNKFWQSVTHNFNSGIDLRVRSRSRSCSIETILKFSSHGLLQGYLLLFTTVMKAAPEDQSERNGTLYLDWLNNVVSPTMMSNAEKFVLVFNGAKRHKIHTEETKLQCMMLSKPQRVCNIH